MCLQQTDRMRLPRKFLCATLSAQPLCLLVFVPGVAKPEARWLYADAPRGPASMDAGER
jgi:hypothetical protein